MFDQDTACYRRAFLVRKVLIYVYGNRIARWSGFCCCCTSAGMQVDRFCELTCPT
jgi:hypothetical protein